MTLRRHLLTAIAAASLAGLGTVPARAATAARPLDITSTVHMLPGGGAILRQGGSFSGAPLGSGTVTLRTTVGAGRGATFSFELTNARGSVHGAGDVALDFKGSTIVYRGTAKLTTGSGAFRTMRASNLRVDGSGPISGATFKVRLTGRVTF